MERARALLAGLRVGPPPRGLDAGRTLGACPECGAAMRPRERRLRCACGHGYPLPARGRVLAVPGASCPRCAAPMLRVDGGPARCADRRECRG